MSHVITGRRGLVRNESVYSTLLLLYNDNRYSGWVGVRTGSRWAEFQKALECAKKVGLYGLL